MTISARIICDSIANDIRLVTLETRAPKFLDAEFEKHRMISSNSSSDRAIPLLKLLDKGYHLPSDVRLNQPGMQGDLLLDEDSKEEFWNDLKDLYGYTANVLKKWDRVHKQHLNRYLMGFSWQNKICTATEYTNFFNLRLDKASDPAMQELAKAMKEAMDRSTPDQLVPGEWHMPYVTEDDHMEDDVDLRKLSVARCARVSYNNHDNTSPNIYKDLELADKLLKAGHMSPWEHVARPNRNPSILDKEALSGWDWGVTHLDKDGKYWSSNFRGWIMYRNLL